MRIKKKYLTVFISILMLIILIQSVHATDDLFLTGIVRSIDSHSGIVTVDVKSEGCSGVRSFRFEDVSAFAYRIDKKISF
ncbi:MAG: hypothetical protein AB1390_04820, partial [Nitrospirota bacterium]